MPPLKFFFSYPDNPVVKSIKAYVSYDKKDPLAALSHPEIHNNPKIIEIRGTLYDPKTGKLDFEKPWIYITLLSQVDMKVRIVARFRQPRKKIVKAS